MIDTKSHKEEKIFPSKVTRDQAKDTGMAMVLIAMLLGFGTKHPQFFTAAVPLLLINMIFPGFYKPAAKIWLGISHIMGMVASRIILSIIFFLLVTPIGFIRKILGKDSLQINKWKKDSASVFSVRDTNFNREQIERPY